MMFLGAPIGVPEFMRSAAAEAVDDMDKMLTRMQILADTGCMDARVPFVLQRSCLGHSKFNHVLRLTPPQAITSELRRADALGKHWYQKFNDVHLSPEASTQIALPVSLGGQGFYETAEIAEAAYLGSLLDIVRHDMLFETEGGEQHTQVQTRTRNVWYAMRRRMPRRGPRLNTSHNHACHRLRT